MAKYIAAIVAAFSLTALSAEAVPITSYHVVLGDSFGNLVGGTITATIDLWAAPTNGTGLGTLTLIDSLSAGIGNDFTVVVPQAIIDAHTPWQATIPPSDPTSRAPPGLDFLTPVAVVAPVTADNLFDYCSSRAVTFPVDTFGVTRRGNCSFATKVTNLEATSVFGAVIINTTPGIGAEQISLGSLLPDIPVMVLSYERGTQIVVDLMYNAGQITFFDFDARWDPDPPTSVPEPGTLSLLGAGLFGLAFLRRRRAA